MDKIAQMVGDNVGDMVEGALKSALGVKSTEKEKGGFMSSLFGGDKKEEDERDRKKDDDDDKGSFFSRFLDRDDDDKKAKRSGFDGLFSELDNPGGPGAGGPGAGWPGAGEPGAGGAPGGTGLSEGDLFGDLMDVAEETAKGK